jgi:hypothetical protein
METQRENKRRGQMIWLFSAISACMYRAGGMKKPFKSWMRDWLIPAVVIATMILLKGFHISWWWAYLLQYLLLGYALSTYWDFITGEDNFWLHGFFCGLGMLPFIFCSIPWWLILIRAIILAISIGGLNLVINKIPWLPFKDWAEELFRGFIVIITLPLLFI